MAKPPRKRKKATSATSRDSTAPDNQDLEDISLQENPGSATITVAAVEIEELSSEEQRDRLHLERRVERAVFEALKALMELRDRRLYRSTHKTFEEYCKERFGYSRRQQSGVFEFTGRFCAEVFGVFGEAEPCLFNWFGRESVKCDRKRLKSYFYFRAIACDVDDDCLAHP